MLKVLIGTVFFSFFALGSFAESCMVSNTLQGMTNCSTEYFKARNQRELDNYLLRGKFKDGKLLNLEIDFDIKENEVNVATSCELKIARKRMIFSLRNGICLKGSSVYLEGENRLASDNKAPVNISALNSVQVRRSSIETKGDLLISTSNFLPFDGEVLISRESLLKARSININSKSNLIINFESKIKADEIVLDGGNCEIYEKNDRDNDDEQAHDRSVKRFSPKFNYSGTCKSNPLPINLKINSKVSSVDSQAVSFNILGVPGANIINWKYDKSGESIGPAGSISFIYSGKHLVQAVVTNSDGYFRKIESFFNVSPTSLNKSQIAVFKFFGSKYAPKKVEAAIDMKKITLTKADHDPELYFADITLDKAGQRYISIPVFDYKGNFNLNILPEISNPQEYLNTKLDEVLTLSNNSPLDDELGSFYESTKLAIAIVKTKINTFSESDKQFLAIRLQANLPADINNIQVSNDAKKTSAIFDFLMSKALAQSAPATQNYDVQTQNKMKEYTTANIKIVKKGIALITIGILLAQIPDPLQIEKAASVFFIFSGGVIILKEYATMAQIISWIYKITDVFRTELDSVFVSSNEGSLKLFGTYVAVT